MSRRWIILSGVGVLVFAILTLGIHNALTAPYPGMNDFMSRWEGARSYWVEGLNPYGAEASLNIQEQIYGRAATDLEDPGLFAYPFYTAFLLLPIVWLNYAWASAIWMSLLIFSLISGVALLLHHFRWRPSPLLLGGLVLWSVISYFPSRGLILGQPGLLVYFLQVLAIWALARRDDAIVGVALAVSTIKPQMGYLFVPFILLWSLREGRWRVIAWFVSAWGGMMLLSFALLPTWFTDWLDQVFLYPSYTEIGGPIWVVSNAPWLGINDVGKWEVFGGYGDVINTVISGILYLYLLWTWFVVIIQRKRDRLMWTIVMTLLITHLVAPRTATPHYVVFMIPLVFYLRWMDQHLDNGGKWSAALLIGLFVVYWAHFLLTVEGEFEHPSLYPPTPFALLILLVWTRRWWWDDPQDRFQEKPAREVTA